MIRSFFPVALIVIGIYVLLISFKIVNPSKKKFEDPELISWYKEYGVWLKILGIVSLITGIALIISVITDI